jgi:tetratricopeptide (TPR) repeat protein/tRNA A-37 threonylcarbamoyl transferase component Bud32
MRKILSAVLLFSLALAAPAAVRLYAEGGNDAAPADGALPVQDTADHHHRPDLRPAGDQFDHFRRTADNHPLESAEALLQVLPTIPKEQLPEFRDKNSDCLFSIIIGLNESAKANKISREDYIDVTTRLAEYDIHTVQGRAGMRGRPPWREPLNAMVDAQIASDNGDKEKAAKAVEQARTDYPDNPAVHTAAATYYNKNNNFAMAEQSASRAIELDSNSESAYKARALARASLADRKGAIDDIKKAMSIDPQDESARVLSALLDSRKPATTLKSVASVEEVKRALGAAGDEGGEAGAVGGGAQAALQASAPGDTAGDQAGQADPARAKAYLKTAMAKDQLGDYQSAVRYASMALDKDPASSEAMLERANAYNFLGRYDDAVRDASAVIEKDPSNLQAFNMRAWALNRKGQAGDAVNDASKAIGLNPNFADAWFNRALAYEKQGDYKKMLEDFKQAAALNGAYSSRYQDAVAQYAQQVPGFAPGAAASRAASEADGEEPARHGRNPLRRFLLTLFFTLTGGGLVAMGLIHIVSSRSEAEDGARARATHPDVLSPSVFYEGVATGKYKIERKLGEGAMGVVYEATDQSLGRKVAIKKMSEEIKVNEREKQRFLDEARTVALLHHASIVEIYTIFEEEGNIYLVFEHVDGATLDTVVDKEARLPLERARDIFGAVSGALAYAHGKNVIHRDLKLSNIMLSSEGAVKVMDFGLASHARDAMARFSNKEVVGSPAYMAPEQDLGVSSVESDVYALGVCLYESLAGVLPFAGPDFHLQKTHRSYQPLSEVVPGLPKSLDAVVAKCLASAPEDRYHSADDFRRALGEIV